MGNGTASDVSVEVSLERPRKLGDIVLDQVRELIVGKRLPPGERLSEAKIAKMLGVSKTPVREALLQLRMIGLVSMIDGNAHVVVPSARLIREAYEVRAGLEALTARLAAERAAPDRRAQLLPLAEASLQAARDNDAAAFRGLDQEFHHAVALASNNATAQQRIDETLVLCQTLRRRDVLTGWDSQLCGQAHVAIAEAINSGDAEVASREMYGHINYVMDRVLSALAGQQQGA
ncbi:GntR-family transcriptional regulator [Streptomyces bingchenggensis BCW-1]|uniref:GntR-family transcriptional regulator n=1 Tax=Streptomyces bingchenggensis (strain BCW-1) TaxID=749414 RepID=D7BUG7_STRBB|nr:MULTISPECIES: GntR family transcriptional regulator [Streptomyces]ADI11716.1 GntR-family transcriptional regulator [Streptomyces bingchenggensis BCW-1]